MQHSPDPPSVIRYYVNLIENLALSWQWGQPDEFEELERVFRHTLALLYEGGTRSPNGCPWPRCPDGLCSPICAIFNDAERQAFVRSELERCPGQK